ncbi:MAG: beta-N-acetylhexosaminidase [Myxococcota bacterium]
MASPSPANPAARAASLLMVGFDGLEPSEDLRAFVREGPPAGVVLFGRNVASTAQVARLIRDLRALWPADGPPPLVAVDQEGGPVRRLKPPTCPEVAPFPAAADVAAPDDPDLTRAVGRVTGRQLAALGFDLDFAPVLDVDSNPANPIIGRRAFGRDPETVTRHGLAYAAGLADAGVLSCGKHFPGHGDTDLDSHLALPHLAHDPARLDRVELAPFRAAVAAGLPALMTAHIVYEALDQDWPATLSPRVIPPLLRDRMGFDGVVISDDLEMAAVADRDPWTLARRGLEATVDLFLVCRRLDRARALRDALASQPDAALEQALRRVGALRRRAADHAATPWTGEVPCQAEARDLLMRLRAK